MSLPWSSNSAEKSGSGSFNPPSPDISEGRPDPSGKTQAIPDNVSWGHEREVPSAHPEHVTSTFPTTGGGIYEGGNSKDRK